MDEIEVRRLGDILRVTGKLDSGLCLLVEHGEEWTVDSRCLLVDVDELDDPDDSVIQGGTQYQPTLLISTIRSVIENFVAQGGDETDTESLVKSLVYFFENDAFLAWDGTR